LAHSPETVFQGGVQGIEGVIRPSVDDGRSVQFIDCQILAVKIAVSGPAIIEAIPMSFNPEGPVGSFWQLEDDDVAPHDVCRAGVIAGA